MTRSDAGIFYIGWKADGYKQKKGNHKLEIVRCGENVYVAVVPSMLEITKEAAKNGGDDSGYQVYWFVRLDSFRIDKRLKW